MFLVICQSIDTQQTDAFEETAFLLHRYGTAGTCYTDSRVEDMINDGAATDGSNIFLLELLQHIHNDWCRENQDDHGTIPIGMFKS